MLNQTPTFQNFWDIYGLKRDRIAAERAWKRLSADDRRDAVSRIAAYKEDCQNRGIRMMYAQGYLNHRRWEDDFATDEGHSESILSKAGTESDAPATMDMW